MEGDCSVVVSSRPLPVFPQSSGFRRRKRTPFRVPRPYTGPSKSCSSLCRLSRNATFSTEPRLVSFKTGKTNDILSSPHYNSLSHKTYLEQCFQVFEKLGDGSFGEVFQVCNHDDGKMYAVKKSLHHFRGEKDRRLKLAEVEKHEQLPYHPNCVKFHQAWEEKHKLYIQTELCQMSLSEYADLHGRIPEQRVWHVLVDLVKGLKHMHDHRLCHLDIKPANAFLAEDGFTCKLGDFGLCTSVDQGFVDAMEGDARYLAPELMNHQFGKAADIFSLGISILELACDMELPTCGENWHMLRQGCIPPHLVKDLSAGLVNMLSRMMHPDPQLRPSVDDILADSCIQLEGYQKICSTSCWQLLHKCRQLLHKCRHMLSKLVGGLALLLAVFPLKKNLSTEDSVVSFVPESKGVGGGEACIMLQNESLYFDGDGTCCNSVRAHVNLSGDADDALSTISKPCFRHGPIRDPREVGSDLPIPLLDFGDSSFDSSPDRPQHSSSPKPASARITIEPKKLVEAFVNS